MKKSPIFSLVVLLGAAVLVHGNGKVSYFARITGLRVEGDSLRIEYTNSPGYSQVWLGATNALRQSNTLWTLIATNSQPPQLTSNAFTVSLAAVSNAQFFRLLAPSSPPAP